MPPTARPVTAALETEILAELRSRGIVIWLDRDGHYTAFAEAAADRHRNGKFAFPVVPFQGSFLELMLALEDYETGLDPTPLLIHMPGFTEDSIRTTPVLEVYKAGFRYRRALETLIRDTATGQLQPDEIDAFLADGEVSLASADEWLSNATGNGRTGLAGVLDRSSLEVVIREMLIKDTFLSAHMDRSRAEDIHTLRAYLARHLSVHESWWTFIGSLNPQAASFVVLKDALASWLLCVEYVDDLTRAPFLPELQALAELPKKTVKLCREQVSGLREHYPSEYETLADQVEGHLETELQRIRPEDLGRIDTFRSEEAMILGAAIEALQAGEWDKARDWAEARAGTTPFWLGRDQRRRMAWDLVSDAAHLGCLLKDHARPLKATTGFEHALARYCDSASLIDQAHRRFEQRRASRLQPQLPHFAKLKDVVGQLRGIYRTWADQLAGDFSGLCRDHGLLPDESLQQRHFFDQDVAPLAQDGERLAVFLVDALRYEMAAELAQDLQEQGTKVKLTARYAELPTVTSVGMNALAPVAQGGRLHLAGGSGFKGFSTGEFVVDSPEGRARSMGLRCTGERALQLSLAEICETEPETLRKRVAQKRLIVVHDREIDEAGEAGVGLAAFEQSLAQIKTAWLHLKAFGVSTCVITSDHGFLLQDETTKTRPYGKKTDPNRRYVLASERRMEDGLLTTSLADLKYDGRDGFLLFPEDTMVFDGRAAGAVFVHGGNSPQERIVPVLTVTGTPSNVDLSAYLVEAKGEEDALGYRRLRVRLVLDREQSAALPFPRSEPISLAIRAAGRPDVRVAVEDANRPAAVKRGQIQAPVGEQWFEVFFTLGGAQEDRVRVEVYHPDGVEQVKPCEVDGWFRVEARAGLAAPETGDKADLDTTSDRWSAALPSEEIRRIFVHINQHGAISEAEAVGILGSPRKFRRFSLRFEELCGLTPLTVRIEVTPEGKRYVREGRGV